MESDPFESPHEVMDWMLRTTRAIMQPDYRDALDVINQTADAFVAELEKDPHQPRLSWQAGVAFYRALIAPRLIPGERVMADWPIPYRDDNRYVWAFSTEPIDGDEQAEKAMIKVYEAEPSADEALEINDTPTPHKAPTSRPFYYDEWDYRTQQLRPQWATVIERRQPLGDPQIMDDILRKYPSIAARIRHLIDALQPQGVVRRRGYEEGEALDLNAAVRAMTDIRRGILPDPRINIRVTRHVRDLAIVVLMDLSESTNEKIGPLARGETGGENGDDEQPSILDLTREATGLLAWAIDAIGDDFAIHGFASNGRHDVQYYRFKDFDQPYNEAAKTRLAGCRGGLSTRMGAALRHAGEQLAAQPAQKRLLLLITDGEPADIDERDPQYLRHDAQKAVQALAARGIHSHCLTLDPNANRYVAQIFGEHHYAIVDQVERLPARLPSVFAAITA